MIVIHNSKKGNNYLIATILAEYFKCEISPVEENPYLENHDVIIFVISNTGDEELPKTIEDYLYLLNVKNKKYIICELGNYFGFENYNGCKKVAFKILDALGWEKISDISLDSLPNLDLDSLKNWLDKLHVI